MPMRGDCSVGASFSNHNDQPFIDVGRKEAILRDLEQMAHLRIEKERRLEVFG
jgi:hypothetical protein